jgi:hypothetical protein
MAASETIKEFLISIKYNIDQSSQTRFQESLGKQEQAARQLSKFHDELAKKVKDLGLIAATTAATFAAGLVAVAKNYEQLYYVVQRTTASAEGLAKLQYAFGQVGLSGDAAVSMILRMTNAIKASPGLAAVLRGYSGDDPSKLFGSARDQTKVLIDFLEGLSKQAPFVRAQIASMFGIAQDDLERLISTLPDLIKAYDDAGKRIQVSGVNMDQFYRDSRTAMNELKTIWMDFDYIWIKAFEDVFPYMDKALKWADQFLLKVEDFNKKTPFAAVGEELAGIIISLRVALGLASSLLGAVAGTAARAVGLGARAAPVAAAGVGTQLAAGGAITAATAIPGAGLLGTGLAIGGGITLGAEIAKLTRPDQIKAPDANTWGGALDAALRPLFRSILPESLLPHYQQGGIVPIAAHAGEIVLPKNLSDGLLALFDRGKGDTEGGGSSLAMRTYEALHSMSTDLYSWLRGGGLFTPKVLPVGVEQQPPFAMLDANGNPMQPGGAQPGPGQPGGAKMVTGLPQPGAEPRWNPSDAISIIEHFESGGRNVLNYAYDALHTASGYLQITNSTWRDFAGKVAGASQYATAISAPREIQEAVGRAIYAARGWSPWSNYDAPLRHYLSSIPATRLGMADHRTYATSKMATMNQTNNFNLVAGGASDSVTNRITRITDRLAADSLRNFQVALQ